MPLFASLLLDLAVATAGANGCQVPTAGADARVEVRPEGGAAFQLELEDVPFLVRLAQSPDRGEPLPHRVRVDGALRFEARLAGRLSFRLARPVELADGNVRLSTDAEVRSPEALGDRARGDFVIASLHVTLRALTVPCDALAVDDIHHPASDEARAPSPGPVIGRFLPRGRRLALRARPRGEVTVALEATERLALQADGLEEREGWIRLAWSSYGGTRAAGWARRSELERETSFGGLGFGTSSHCRAGCTACHGHASDEYLGPATVRAGAPVYASPGAGRWAEVAAAGTYQVLHRRGAAWVQLVEVGQIEEHCGSLDHAFLAAADVTLPAEPAIPR